MVFRYKWGDKTSGNYAIRRKDTNGKPAGKFIEPNTNQTSATHFFILVDEKDIDSMTNLYRINDILETVNFEYVNRGTGKKSLTRYLIKNDIEDVLKNIEKYRDKTVKIENRSKDIENINNKIKDGLKNISKNYEKNYQHRYCEIIDMLKEYILKEEGLKNKKREAKKRIKKINDDLSLYETTANAEMEKLEKRVFKFMKNKNSDLQYNGGEIITNNFQKILPVLKLIAKKDKQRLDQNERMKKSRKKKNELSGKPKRNVGRPRKTEK